MPRLTITANILAGESLSSVVDLSDGTAVFLHMPMQWTPALLTFQVAPDGTNFSDLVDMDAREIAVNVRAGTTIHLGNWVPSAAGYLKIRSGSTKHPIAQAETRGIIISGVTGVSLQSSGSR
jgi:hypothetical protein